MQSSETWIRERRYGECAGHYWLMYGTRLMVGDDSMQTEPEREQGARWGDEGLQLSIAERA